MFFLNDSTLFLSKSFPKCKSSRKIDVWRKRKNSWSKIVSDQLYEVDKTRDTTVVTATNYPFYYFNSHSVLVGQKLLGIILQFVPCEVGMRHNEYYAYQDKYFSEHDLKFQLVLYDWEIVPAE